MDCKEFERQFKAREIRIEALVPAGLSCVKCWATGFVWVDVDGIAAWAYCNCFEGRQKYKTSFWGLPLYDAEMASLFKLKAFPAKAFIPSAFDSFKQGLNNKMGLFKNDLKLSEKFWSQK